MTSPGLQPEVIEALRSAGATEEIIAAAVQWRVAGRQLAEAADARWLPDVGLPRRCSPTAQLEPPVQVDGPSSG
jgi:hypothetical protein